MSNEREFAALVLSEREAGTKEYDFSHEVLATDLLKIAAEGKRREKRLTKSNDYWYERTRVYLERIRSTIKERTLALHNVRAFVVRAFNRGSMPQADCETLLRFCREAGVASRVLRRADAELVNIPSPYWEGPSCETCGGWGAVTDTGASMSHKNDEGNPCEAE